MESEGESQQDASTPLEPNPQEIVPTATPRKIAGAKMGLDDEDEIFHSPLTAFLNSRKNKQKPSGLAQPPAALKSADAQVVVEPQPAGALAPKAPPPVDVALQAMKTLESPEDLVLMYLSSKAYPWPMRRIRSVNGLNATTFDDLKRNGLMTEQLKVKDGVYAKVDGDPTKKWYLYDKAKTKKISFTDSVERGKLSKFLETGKKETDERKKLRMAMSVAEEMYNACLQRRAEAEAAVEPASDQGDEEEAARLNEEARRAEAAVRPKAQPLPHQRSGSDDTMLPVSFKPGMVISVKRPNVPDSKQAIIEIFEVAKDNYRILLHDSSYLTDDVMVGAGENRLLHPFGELKCISTFVCGRKGDDIYSRVGKKVEEGRAKLEKQVKRLKKDLGELDGDT